MTHRLADLVFAGHVGYVAFVVCAPLLLAAGALLSRPVLRGQGMRSLHLSALAFVALQWTCDWPCPLTLLEDRLRGRLDSAPFLDPAALDAAPAGLLPTVVGAYLVLSVLAHHLARRADHGA